MKHLVLIAAALLTASPLAAQMRREAGPGGPPGEAAAGPTFPRIPYDAAHPFSGVWEGTFEPRSGEAVPLVVVIEYLNGGYTGYQFLSDARRPGRHLSDSLVAPGVLVWEQPNSGGGFLVHTARLQGRDQIDGTLTFRDFDAPGGATFTLRRRT